MHARRVNLRARMIEPVARPLTVRWALVAWERLRSERPWLRGRDYGTPCFDAGED